MNHLETPAPSRALRHRLCSGSRAARFGRAEGGGATQTATLEVPGSLGVRLRVLIVPLALVVSGLAGAQAPPGYYDTVDTATAANLRATLHAIIDDHTRFPYTSSSTDTWDILEIASEDPNNASNILDVYRNESFVKAGGGNNFYNREHTWPKSYGFPNDGSTNYIYTDCHQLFLCDSGYNSSRSNKPYRNCSPSCSEKTTVFNFGQGGGSGVYPGNSNWTSGSFTQGTWETWAGRRGDVARAVMYVDVRYEGGSHGVTNAPEPDLILTDTESLIEGSNTGQNESVAYMGMLSVILQWHQQDPPDALEMIRNDVVFSFQGNRNPFIDHPEWADCLYGGACGGGDATAPAAPTGLIASGGDSTVDLNWSDSPEPDLAGYDVLRAAVSGGPYVRLNAGLLTTSLYSDASAVNGTTYYFVVTASDFSANESAASAEVFATPEAGPPSSDPWINEFHYDNAGADTGEFIEIAGPAGLNLSGWTLHGYNGNGGSTYNFIDLSGLIPDQENCVGTLSFSFTGLQNGSPDGMALVSPSSVVVEFLTYEGTLTATGGPASGMTSVDVGVSESSTTPIGFSLQRGGTGGAAAAFTWQSELAATPGQPNTGQTFDGCSTAAVLDPELHAFEVGSFFQGGSQYADVWGEGNTVYLGHFGQSVVDILDLTNPGVPVLLASYSLSGANASSSAQDVKSGDGLLFIASESGGIDGVEIVDVRTPSSPTLLTRIDAEPGPYEFIHNTSYDNGWLYLCDSSNPSIAIVDLRTFDPDAAPATLTSWAYELTGVGGSFVHDITVANGRLWVSAWDSTQVFDISNLGSQAPVFMGQSLGLSAHAVWATDDGKFVVSTEERGGGAIRLYRVTDDGSTVRFVQRDSFASPRSGTGSTFSSHNPVMVADRIYVSNYSAGVAVLQIDRTSETFEVVASYDTTTLSPDGFAGCWGVYPQLGEDAVVVSDIENGLYVLDMRALDLTTPAGRPTRVSPETPSSLEVSVTELGLTRDDLAVTLHARIDGGAFTPIAMVPVGGDSFRADLPAVPCAARIDYYYTADDSLGETFSKPAAAPAETYSTWATSGLTTILYDDFESDLGWTVTNTSVSTGAWVRVDPLETAAQPGEGAPGSAGPFCYVTAQGSLGGPVDAADLDGGPTRLISPALDFSGGDGLISYSRWLFNDDVDTDDITVEISNDNGASWTTVETVQAEAGGWIQNRFRVSDFVSPTAQVLVRFSASDQPNDSVTEAAIDEFRAELFGCPVVTLASVVERNGSGTNPVCFTSSTVPVLGSLWSAQVDASVRSGADGTWIFAFSQPLTGLQTPYGELLVALPSLGGAPLFATSMTSSGGLDTHTVSIPADPAFAGFAGHAQGIVSGAGLTLCNALDLILGF